ncbi:MAG: hypothetical protein KGL46_03190 [Hyphomicrobiales bacterium]|nr:hypothetical protein [Hyphomicrobiales bacterium]
MVKGDVTAGVVELLARHGEAMKDPNFFIETLFRNGFDEEEIAICESLVLPRIDEWFSPPTAEGLSEPQPGGFKPMSPFARRFVMTTIGRTIAKSAQTAAEQELIGIDAIVEHVAASVSNPPAPTPEERVGSFPAATSTSKRTRNPQARELILRELAECPATPAQLAARLARGTPSKRVHDNVRKLLQRMKRDGSVVANDVRYRIAGTTAATQSVN